MNLNLDSLAMQYAKRKKFIDLHDSLQTWMPWLNTVKLVKFKYKCNNVLCKMSCEFVDKLSLRTFRALLMREDSTGCFHDVIIDIPMTVCSERFKQINWEDPVKNGVYFLDCEPIEWTTYVFDKLCSMSDVGMKLVYVAECNLKNKVELLLKPYNGSKVKIEAELNILEFVYLDEIVEVPF